MWQRLEVGPVDPILQMLAAYHQDPNPDKVDLGIGVYRDGRGMTPIFQAVKKAEQRLLKQEASKAYLGPAGDGRFTRAILTLLLPGQADDPRLCCLQTPGGTGALRVAGDLIKRARSDASLWLSDPPWVTHRPIFQTAGLRLQYYRYFNPQSHGIRFEQLCEDLTAAAPGDVVLLQAAAHNPTGCDLSAEQWEELVTIIRQRHALPLLDIAYQGLADNLNDDLQLLRIVDRLCPEWIASYSASKTFGLYNERTGALILKTADSNTTARVRSEALNRICANYYMPPAHGASVVVTILESEELAAIWQAELEQGRQRLQQCRGLLSDRLNALSAGQYRYLSQQRGMFSYLGLSDRQLERLRGEFSIYMGSGGRINVAGINPGNLQPVCNALLACSQSSL